MRIRVQNELLIIIILTALLVAIVTFFPSNVWRVILGLPLLLFFPGYSLVAAIFPRGDDLHSVGRIALSFGLSFTLSSPEDSQQVEFLLYNDGKGEPYRKLSLWVDVKE